MVRQFAIKKFDCFENRVSWNRQDEHVCLYFIELSDFLHQYYVWSFGICNVHNCYYGARFTYRILFDRELFL